MASGNASEGPVGLVLAGGGARGAYEAGALSALLPALEREGHRPRVIVGTSVGALNTAFLAATAADPVQSAAQEGIRIWSGLRFGQVLSDLGSVGEVRRLVSYVGQFLGIDDVRLQSLLDPAPLRETLARAIQFPAIEQNVRSGALDAVGIVATSAATSRSVVFHRGGNPPAHDDGRGIDYVGTRLAEEHVLASAAIPGAFPAVHVSSPARARGWYFDGGTRLNTPIKPALALGAGRVVVVALNSVTPSPARLAGARRPDALEGASQLIQAALVDPLIHDVQTLAMVNSIVDASGAPVLGGKKRVPYILVAPRDPEAIGRRAQAVYDEHFSDLLDTLRARDLAFLGRVVAGGSDPTHGELLSYLFFASEFAKELIELGRADAERWLADEHDDGLWQTEQVSLAGAGAAVLKRAARRTQPSRARSPRALRQGA
jgi:NTE family protein